MVNLVVTVFSFVYLLILLLPAFLFSRLLKIEHDTFYAQWERDGRPVLFPFWIPWKKTQFLALHWYPWRMGYLWLFKTPDWVKENQKSWKLFKYYRLVSYFVITILITICLITVFIPSL